MNTEYRIHLRFAGMMLLLAIAQIAVGDLISIAGIVTSFLLIGIVFIALLRGQVVAMLHGFPAGLLVDLYAGEVVGITSMALVTVAFLIGFFYEEDRRDVLIRSLRMVLLITLAAFLFNLIYLFTYFRSLEIDILQLVLLHVIGGMLYTGVLGAIPVMILARIDRKLTM